MYLVDSHCHLSFPEFADQRAATIARARDAGVRTMQTICTSLDQCASLAALTAEYADLFSSVGVHPSEVGTHPPFTTADLLRHCAGAKVIGIGETGLDYYRGEGDRDAQKAAFIRHIEASQETQLPLIVHTREAEDDTIAMIQAHKAVRDFPVVIHCFTGTARLAEATLECGCFISVSGIVTFKNATALQAVVATLPLSQMLIETDAPYLAPMPHRGRTNEPGFLVHTAQKIAELKALSLAEVAQHSTDNFFRLFARATRSVQ